MKNVEFMVKNFLTKKPPGSRGSTEEFYQKFKGKNDTNSSQTLPEIGRRGNMSKLT